MAEELDKAIAYVEQHASDAPKAALVLDIDETSLSNWPALLTSDYAFIKKGTCDPLEQQKSSGCSLCITMHRSALTIRPTGSRTSNLRCQSRSPSANGKQGRQKKPAAGGISAAGSCMSLAVANSTKAISHASARCRSHG